MRKVCTRIGDPFWLLQGVLWARELRAGARAFYIDFCISGPHRNGSLRPRAASAAMTAHATITAMLPVLLCVVLWPLLITAVRALQICSVQV